MSGATTRAEHGQADVDGGAVETIVELRLLTAVFSQSSTVPPAQGAPALPLTSIT